MSTLVTRQNSDALALAETWQRLPEDDRKRRAATAANQHDGATLAELTVAHLQLQKSEPSKHTVSTYRNAILRLATTWQAAGENMLRPTRNAGHLYVRQLEASTPQPSKHTSGPLATYSAATVRVHLAACAALYRALRWAGATEAHPFADVRAKRDARKNHEKREAFTEHDLGEILKNTSATDAALVLLGARAGLRLAEALALTWDAVHLDTPAPILEVKRGKGGKYRTVPLVPELAEALRTLRSTSTDAHVLPYRSATRARQRLARLQQRAGIEVKKGRAIHSLRHSAGTAVYAATGDLVAVQGWLGHAAVETSRGYVHRSEAAALARVAAILPRLAPK